MSVEAYVPEYALPDVNKLSEKLMKSDPFSFGEARRESWGDATVHTLSTNGVDQSAPRNGVSSSATMIGAWSHLLSARDLTLMDIYSKPQTLTMPEGVSPRLGIDMVRLDDHAFKLLVSIFAAYQLFGIPVDEWERWRAMDGVGSAPHFIYRYRLICREFGMPPITPEQYAVLFSALRDFNMLPKETYYGAGETSNKVSLEWMTSWAKMTKLITAAGVEPATIQDLGYWVADNWHWEAIINLNRAGVTLIEAKQLWDSGLADSTLIQQHLVDGVPLDWVMNIHTARKGTA